LATAEADAKAITARAGALSGENQRLIAANTLVEILPELVAAAAQGIEGTQLTISTQPRASRTSRRGWPPRA